MGSKTEAEAVPATTVYIEANRLWVVGQQQEDQAAVLLQATVRAEANDQGVDRVLNNVVKL